MTLEAVPASVAFARLCLEGARDPREAWRDASVPERMVIALGVLDDPRWMMRAVCVAWRSVAAGRLAGTSADGAIELSRAIDAVLAAYEAWASGDTLDAIEVRATLDALDASHGHVAWGLGVLLDLIAEPHDPARDAHAVASMETASEAAIDLGAIDRTAVRLALAEAIRASVDPFAALEASTRTIALPSDDHEDEIPF